VNVVSVGNAQILTIPGEALPNIGFYLKRKMYGQHNLLFGLTNDAFGYILTKEDFDSFKRYAYITRTSLGERTGEIFEASPSTSSRLTAAAWPTPTLPAPSCSSTVPSASVNVMVRWAVGSAMAREVRLASGVAPSKTSACVPCTEPLTVIVSAGLLAKETFE
jgi:hypothetical protein